MSVDHVEFLVEEPSMEVFLRGLLPRLLGPVHFEIRAFQCKEDLLKRLPDRLRGYAWFPEAYRIVVVVDRDSDDCRQLKQELERHARQAGLPRPGASTHLPAGRRRRGERPVCHHGGPRLVIEPRAPPIFPSRPGGSQVHPPSRRGDR